MTVAVNVLVEDAHLASIGEVAAALEAAGVTVDSVQATTGTITGTVGTSAQLSALSSIPGVAAVEPSRGIQLPPPDAPIQ